MTQGWQCPTCFRVYAPTVTECSHCPAEIAYVPATLGVYYCMPCWPRVEMVVDDDAVQGGRHCPICKGRSSWCLSDGTGLPFDSFLWNPSL